MNVAALRPIDCRGLIAKLTDAQKDALRAVCVHGNCKAAAKELGITPNAAKNRMALVYERIGVSSGYPAAVIAAKAGLV